MIRQPIHRLEVFKLCITPRHLQKEEQMISLKQSSYAEQNSAALIVQLLFFIVLVQHW